MVYLISGCVQIHMDMYTKGIVQMIKDRSYAMSCIALASHLYPVVVGALPAVWGVTYKKFN